jgi:hypothetical protein
VTDGHVSADDEPPLPPSEPKAATALVRPRRFILIAIGVVLLLVGAAVAVVLVRGKTSGAKPVAAPSTLAAIRATAKSGVRPFTITAALTPALASYFGGSAITGTGIADFGSDKAQWTLSTPAQMGKTIAVFADRGTTYVDLGATGQWVSLQSAADYRGYDQVPLVRDLVVLTNPFRELNLAESTPATPHPKHLSLGASRGHGLAPGVVPAAYLRALTSVTQSVDCNNGSAASTQGGQSAQGSPDTKVLTTDFGLSSETDAETMQTVSSWPKTTTTMDSVDSGVCSIDTTVEQAANGYDITIVFNNPVPASTTTTPNFTVQRTYSYTQVFHYAVPCDQGTWHGTSHLTIPGFSNVSGGASASQTDLTGGGDLTISLGASHASLTSDETFTARETSVLTVPGADGQTTIASTHPVTYTRKFNQDGLAQGFPTNPTSATNSPTSVVIDLTLRGDVALSETGSFIGPRQDDRPAMYGLQATIDCTTHTFALNSTAFGDITLALVSAAPPALQSTSLSQDWRTQLLTQTPTANPTAPSSGTPAPSAPTGPAVPLLNVLGSGKASWATQHHADPAIDGGFDPNPDAYPGSPSQDQFLGVQYLNGLVDSYIQQFAPNTNQAAADTQVRTFLPADAVQAVPATPLGSCAAEEWTSRSLAAAVGKGSQGTITVTYTAQYGFNPTSYNPADNRTAFIAIDFGAVIPQPQLTASICG